MTYDYNNEETGEYNDSVIDKILFMDKKKLGITIIVLIILIFGTLIATGIISPDFIPGLKGKEKISFISEEGTQLKVRGSVTTAEGETETFSTEGEEYNITMNPNENRRVSIQTRGITTGLSVGSVTVIGPNGEVISTSTDNVTYDENGQLILIINPNLDLLGVDGQQINEGEENEYVFQVTLTDTNTGEEVVFEIPLVIVFAEFIGTGCISINRSTVTQTTHYGELELTAKLRVLCSTEENLMASVNWNSKNMGPVEVLFNSSYTNGTSLVSDPQVIAQKPDQGEYQLKVFFVPSTNYSGDRARFDVDFKYGNATSTIKFDVAVENLEQCISVTTNDPIITSEGDEATILIDAKNCRSKKINIYLCDDDYGCSGGASEGEINLSDGSFSLAGGKNKSITVSRGEIAGVYGVSVHANIPGMEKTFVDEKEITVLPTTEYVYPEKFVVSLLEVGTKDSVTIRNTILAEDVDVSASICDLYDKSLGVTDAESWLYKMSGNYDYYSGEGLFVAGFTRALNDMDAAMFSAKNLSYAENTLIKDAYLSTKDVEDTSNDLLEDAASSLEAAEDLADELDGITSNENVNLASSITSLLTSVTATVAEAAILKTNIEVIQTSLETTVDPYGTCLFNYGAISGPVASARSALTSASSASNLYYAEIAEGLSLLNNLYSIWLQIEALTEEDQTIDAQNAVDNAEDAYDSITEWEAEANDALDYMDLALEAAAIDALSSASSDDLEAKEYLELAKSGLSNVKDYADEAYAYQLAAYDAITTALPEEAEVSELVSQGISLIFSLTGSFGIGLTKSSAIQTALATANTQVTAASNASKGIEATCNPPFNNNPCVCTGLSAALTSAVTPKLAAAQGSAAAQAAKWANYISLVNSLYQAFQLYESLHADFAEVITAANEQFAELTDGILDAQLDAYLAYTDAENAILAAQKLYNYEKESSDASTYNFDNYVRGDFYEKRRMQGVIGSIISTGFVDGAKEGGVYSTSDTVGAADCSNQVTMKLPDYKINLIHDAGQVSVSNNDVLAQWDFSEAAVYDFFAEQEAAITFSDNGLTQNSYALVEIPVKKHSHAATTLATGDFGPFNLPDSQVEDLVYKYHFKFNMQERKAANPSRTAVCEKGILFGETGEEAGAQTILSWDWNSINSKSIEGKYLDATQLSILISKKLSILDNFFKRVSVSCPKNYAFEAAKLIVPSEIELVGSSDCYLPLSTKYYEGKPSLYHQLDYVVDTSTYPDGYDSFFDEPIISNAEEFLEVVEFNVNLMLDGYGTNFQDDFEKEYTTTLFKANAAFTDPTAGTYKYFSNDNIFFYSSKAKSYSKYTDFVIPDAGKYRVRILIDFDGDSPQLFSGGATKAKIIVDLELIEPINEDYSPLYYTPFDGSVGLKINNNRKDYGTALSNGSEFDVVKKEGIYLTTDQKDALAKLKSTKLQNFIWMNTLASRRAKILDYTHSTIGDSNLVFSPSTATPILMKINGTLGSIPYLTYLINKNRNQVNASSNSLFLWTGINGCNDFYGGKLNELINNTPDYRSNDVYGMFFAQPTTPGAVYLKTVAYTPTEAAYGLVADGDGDIITPNYLIPVDGAIQMDGISGMPYNDLPNNSNINSLLDIFDAVDNGAVCVSQLGNREIYWWPEEYLYEKDNVKGDNLRDLELAAKSICIR